MRRAFVVITFVTLAAAAVRGQADILAKLGSNTEEAHEAFFSSLAEGSVSMAGTAAVFKAAAPEARAAMVTSVVNLARAYAGTADFTRRWMTFREQHKPSAHEALPSMAEMQAMQRKGLEEGIANLEKTAKQLPQMKATFDEQIKAMRQQLAELSKTNPADNAKVDANIQKASQAANADYQKSVADWEKAYPVDPKPFIVKRLRDFLALSATVDYAAKTTKGKDGMSRFDNPAYETKDDQWKYMYRAGKPAVDAARVIAQDWLKALGG